jgi:alkylhydroperoxidase/carboxymuconolactone decarboxylase family protein YurZ
MYDTTNLGQLPHLKALAPQAMHAFETFDRAAMAAGTIPRKFKELIALGVPVQPRSPPHQRRERRRH